VPIRSLTYTRAARAPARPEPAPAVSRQRAERGLAALGGAIRHPVRADRFGGRAGKARSGALSRGADRAWAQAGAAALSDARDLCRRERSAGSGRGAALSAAILGIVEPLHAVHRRRSAPRQLRFLATA